MRFSTRPSVAVRERYKTPPAFMCPNTAIDKNLQAAQVAQPQHGMAPRFVVYAATKDADEQRVTQKFSLIEQGTHNTSDANEGAGYTSAAHWIFITSSSCLLSLPAVR